MADPANDALIADLAEASSHFAIAAVNALELHTKLDVADKIAAGATFEVTVRLEPFDAKVTLVAPDGEAVEIGRVACA